MECTTDAPKLKKLKRKIPSASTALLFGLVLGVLVTLLLVFLSKPLLALMGVKSVSNYINYGYIYTCVL